jgi:hypothetical protein
VLRFQSGAWGSSSDACASFFGKRLCACADWVGEPWDTIAEKEEGYLRLRRTYFESDASGLYRAEVF